MVKHKKYQNTDIIQPVIFVVTCCPMGRFPPKFCNKQKETSRKYGWV